ncbi:MAG TPA: hypothetical protein VFW66_03945 [Gemmatimonadales bacterium]|nr:hypothetical protein [Gemmatimonadales bacterium]
MKTFVAATIVATAAGVVLHYASLPNFGRPFEGLPPMDVGFAYHTAVADGAPPGQLAALRGQRAAALAHNCSNAPRVRINTLLDSFPEWDDGMLSAAACRRVAPWMTPAQVRAALGPPRHIVPSLDGLRPVEQWLYPTVSVFFWDGHVRSWQ